MDQSTPVWPLKGDAKRDRIHHPRIKRNAKAKEKSAGQKGQGELSG